MNLQFTDLGNSNHEQASVARTVEKQPNTFRVPSPSDTDEDSEEEPTHHHHTREPSLELLSTKRITNTDQADRVVSEDVVVVSQSRVTNGNNKVEAHVDLTEVDPPGSSPMQALVVDDESATDAPSAIIKTNGGKGPDTPAVAMEPVRSSGTYKLDYSEEEEEEEEDDDSDDASHESDEDHYYEGQASRWMSQGVDKTEPHSEKLNNKPSSAPNDLELIEELLELDGSEDGHGEEHMSNEDSKSVQEDKSGNAVVQDTYAPIPHPPPTKVPDNEQVPACDDDEEMTGSESVASLNDEDSLFDELEKEHSSGHGLHETSTNGPFTSSPLRDQTDERDTISVYDSTDMDTDYSSPEEDMDGGASIMANSDLSDEDPFEDEVGHQEKERMIPATKSTQYDAAPAIAPYGKFTLASQRAPSPSDAAMAKPIVPQFSGSSGKREQYIPPNGQIATNIEAYPRADEISYLNSQFYYPPPLPPIVGGTFSAIPSFVQGDPMASFGAFDSGPQSANPFFHMGRYDHGQPNIHLDVRPNMNDEFQNTQNANLRAEPKSSKVHISDIVNSSPAVQPLSLSAQTPSSENSRSNVVLEKDTDLGSSLRAMIDDLDHQSPRVAKRKASEMEEATEESHMDSISKAAQDDVLVEKSQSISIPDAQPREIVTFTSQLVEDSLPQLEKVSTEAKEVTDSQRNGSAKGLSTSHPKHIFQLIPSRGEPPHKKPKIVAKPLLKPMAKKRGTVVKTFVSGCIAGAVTVVGAAAALIATMPTSVQEEALRSI